MGGCCASGLNDSSRHEFSTTQGVVHGLTISANAMSCVLLAMDVEAGKLEPCNLMKGEHKTPDFLRKNPFHQIPTWEGPDGTCIGESCAILRHLANVYAPKFYSKQGPKHVARIDFALDALSTNLMGKWSSRTYPVLGFGLEHDADQEAANLELKEQMDAFTVAFLDDGRFCCGSEMTIVEYRALPMLYVLQHPQMQRQTGLRLTPRLERYVDDIMANCSSSGLLRSADGFGLDEYLDGKGDQPTYPGKNTVMIGETRSGPKQNSTHQVGTASPGEVAAKIWGVPMSMNVQTCVLFAKEHGIGDLAPLDVMKGEHKKPEFLVKNVFHQVPTYEGSDGFTLGESSAILRYMASNYKPTYYPADAAARGRVDWALEVITNGMVPKIARGIVLPVMGFAPPPGDQARANEVALEFLESFEAAFLAGSDSFILGNQVTIAEYKAVPYLFAAHEPAVAKKTGFVLPPRCVKYLQNILSAISADSLANAGGKSIRDVLNVET